MGAIKFAICLLVGISLAVGFAIIADAPPMLNLAVSILLGVISSQVALWWTD